MSELGKKIATRESYGNALVELGKEHEDLIVLDADLAGATKTGIRHVCGGQKLRAGAQLDRLPAPQCEDRSDPCWNLRG